MHSPTLANMLFIICLVSSADISSGTLASNQMMVLILTFPVETSEGRNP